MTRIPRSEQFRQEWQEILTSGVKGEKEGLLDALIRNQGTFTVSIPKYLKKPACPMSAFTTSGIPSRQLSSKKVKTRRTSGIYLDMSKQVQR